MDGRYNDEYVALEARISDYIDRSERGELCVSKFLAPSELIICRKLLARGGVYGRAVFDGGYDDAERQRLFLLPAYLDEFSGDAHDKLLEYYPEEHREGICAMSICGSGFAELTHRDFLGAVLGLGIERDVLGDVIVRQGEAILFSSRRMAEFISENLERVGRDRVRSRCISDLTSLELKRDFLHISDTIASPRFDCVVAALANISREKAQTMIESGLCELDYFVCERTDMQITPPATVVIRGNGKYIVRSFDGLTRKGRLRMSADKYV